MIKLYKKTLADVIITDIVMPGMEGLEAIKKLRDEFKDVKIIALPGGRTYKINRNFSNFFRVIPSFYNLYFIAYFPRA